MFEVARTVRSALVVAMLGVGASSASAWIGVLEASATVVAPGDSVRFSYRLTGDPRVYAPGTPLGLQVRGADRWSSEVRVVPMVAQGRTVRGEFSSAFLVPADARPGAKFRFRLHNIQDRSRPMPPLSAEIRVALPAVSSSPLAKRGAQAQRVR